MSESEGPAWYRPYPTPLRWTPQSFALYCWHATGAYFARVLRVFGTKLIVYVVLVQLILKGAAHAVLMATLLPLFKNGLGIPASGLQVYTMVAMLPWSLKPLLGLLTDHTVLGGYHKRWWMLGTLATGVASMGLAYAALAGPSAGGVVACFAGAVLQIALFDLMVESAYSTVMREHPYTGADMPVLVRGSEILGGTLVMTFVGALSDAAAYRALLAVTLVLLAVPAPLTWMNWLGEERVSDSCCWELAEGMTESRGSVGVVAGAGVAALAVTLVANVWSPDYAAVLALLAAGACIAGAYQVFDRVVAGLALYSVLTTVSRPAMSSALDYFYTADAQCLPGGPHFSFRYYQTVVGIIAAGASLTGVWVYHVALSGMRYRRVMVLVTVLRTLGGLSDLWLVKRWNVALGVPDKLAYVVGEAMMEPAIGMLSYTAGTVLTSKVVPKGLESSVYAFLAGVWNFSSIASRLAGVIVYDAAGVRTVVEPNAAHCDFGPLGALIGICHIALPLLVGVPAAWFLIPDSAQDEALLSVAQEEDVWLDNSSTDMELE